MATWRERFRSGWNAFINNKDPTPQMPVWTEGGSSYRPDRGRLRYGNERSIVNAIYNRIAIDVASIAIRHVRLDENGRFSEYITDGLDNVFTLDANVDQTGRAFVQDAVMSMFDEGCVVLVPVDTDDEDPNQTGSFDILTMRTGQVVEWFPSYVKVRVYNERIGRREDILMSKQAVAIIENPLYAIMNAPNSTLQRLIRKLNYLDAIDEQSSSGKLDLIIQLPYTVKSEARRNQAEQRRKDIEMQLTGSRYGIAYVDATEHITQLNRAVENNMMGQIEYLTTMLHGQLGITDEVMKGTASEEEMLNYHSRTIEPILSAICDECKRKFLTKTARTQGQTIMFFRDPFRLIPTNKIADIADKFTRNEILTSNEVRGIIGMRPSEDPGADELRNKNLNQAKGAMGAGDVANVSDTGAADGIVEELLQSLESSIDEIIGGVDSG